MRTTQIDALVTGGVTALECWGGKVSVMRGITTRTKTGQTQDATFRELGTILIVDDVVPGHPKKPAGKVHTGRKTMR